MIIDCVSDLHGHYPKLEGGDLLIVAGDLTAGDSFEQHLDFSEWLDVQPYNKKIVISGNHDNHIDTDSIKCLRGCYYLEDSGTEFEDLKIWGSPWTRTFEGINPKCKAFTCETEEEMCVKFSLIPNDIDILITHSPPHGILDAIPKYKSFYYAGSLSLRNEVIQRVKPKLHVYGHIHERGGQIADLITTKFVNASYVNELYEPINRPVRVSL